MEITNLFVSRSCLKQPSTIVADELSFCIEKDDVDKVVGGESIQKVINHAVEQIQCQALYAATVVDQDCDIFRR